MQLGLGKRFAISDIHGCGNTFIELLDTIQLQKDDNLFILGDMINRGKHSKKVIKTIRNLSKEGYNVFPIRGNHEQYLIGELLKNDTNEFFKFCKRIDLDWIFHEGTLELKKKYVSFFTSLPFYYDLHDILISHAGFDLSNKNIFENTYAMLHQREFSHVYNIPNNKKIIHGHTPISLEKIKRSLQKENSIINIDNGCVYKSTNPDKGNLVCLDMDSLELFATKNID